MKNNNLKQALFEVISMINEGISINEIEGTELFQIFAGTGIESALRNLRNSIEGNISNITIISANDKASLEPIDSMSILVNLWVASKSLDNKSTIRIKNACMKVYKVLIAI